MILYSISPLGREHAVHVKLEDAAYVALEQAKGGFYNFSLDIDNTQNHSVDYLVLATRANHLVQFINDVMNGIRSNADFRRNVRMLAGTCHKLFPREGDKNKGTYDLLFAGYHKIYGDKS